MEKIRAKKLTFLVLDVYYVYADVQSYLLRNQSLKGSKWRYKRPHLDLKELLVRIKSASYIQQNWLSYE